MSRLMLAFSREWIKGLAQSMGIILFTLIALQLARLGPKLLQLGLTPRDFAWILPRLIPAFLVLALPVSGLYALLSMLGRWKSHGEWLALQSSGAGWRALKAPILIWHGFLAILVGLMAFQVGPLSLLTIQEKLQTRTQAVFWETLRSGQAVELGKGFWLKAREVRDEHEVGGVILHRETSTESTGVNSLMNGSLDLWAKSACLTSSTTHAGILELNGGGWVAGGDLQHSARFDVMRLDMAHFGGRSALPAFFFPWELKTQTELAEELSSTGLEPEMRRNLLAEFHRRIMLCLLPWVFGLFALALFSRFPVLSPATALTITVLGAGAANLLERLGFSLVQRAALPVWLGGYLPLIAMSVLALYLILTGKRTGRKVRP